MKKAMPLLKKNEIVQLTIDSISSEGNGVGRKNGLVVFVPGTLPGDEALIKIVKNSKHFSYGRLETLLAPGPERIESDCPVSGTCGGCCFRELSYEAELRVKHGFVKDALKRVGGFNLSVAPVVPSPSVNRYRNKTQYPAAMVDNVFHYGFYAERSHRIIPCADCKLQPKNINEIAQTTAEWLRQNKVAAYDETTHTGLVRHICLRQSSLDGSVLLTLVLNGSGWPGEKEMAARVAEKHPEIKGVLLNQNKSRGNVIFGQNTRLVWGKSTLSDTLCEVPQTLGPTSFSQVNHAGAETLFSLVRQWAAPQKDDVLLDLYCGAGVIGLSMAKQCKTLLGVEIDKMAIESARQSAAAMQLSNTRFLCMDASKAAQQLLEEGVRPNLAVLDPPRKGCGKDALLPLLMMRPGRIVMVSCNPATLARDLAFLFENGYQVEKVQPVDLFPRTRHVECVVLLSKTPGKEAENPVVQEAPL